MRISQLTLIWSHYVPPPLKWPSGKMKGLTQELPIGDQPVGRINQLSEHMSLGRGHSFITASSSRGGLQS